MSNIMVIIFYSIGFLICLCFGVNEMYLNRKDKDGFIDGFIDGFMIVVIGVTPAAIMVTAVLFVFGIIWCIFQIPEILYKLINKNEKD